MYSVGLVCESDGSALLCCNPAGILTASAARVWLQLRSMLVSVNNDQTRQMLLSYWHEFMSSFVPALILGLDGACTISKSHYILSCCIIMQKGMHVHCCDEGCQTQNRATLLTLCHWQSPSWSPLAALTCLSTHSVYSYVVAMCMFAYSVSSICPSKAAFSVVASVACSCLSGLNLTSSVLIVGFGALDIDLLASL